MDIMDIPVEGTLVSPQSLMTSAQPIPVDGIASSSSAVAATLVGMAILGSYVGVQVGDSLCSLNEEDRSYDIEEEVMDYHLQKLL